MEYDNLRDSKVYGYDSGIIIEGCVTFDDARNEYVVIDEDGKAFSSQEFFKLHTGRNVRFTCIDMESAEKIEEMLRQLQGTTA